MNHFPLIQNEISTIFLIGVFLFLLINFIKFTPKFKLPFLGMFFYLKAKADVKSKADKLIT